MSTHAVNIIEIDNVSPHPNADKLQLTKIGGWQCVIGKDIGVGDRAIYIEPDYVVNTEHPAFSFLKKDGKPGQRIAVRKFRGQLSQGLIIPVPDDLKSLPTGSNVIEQLGITRYEPPENFSTYAEFRTGPSLNYVPKFDVESYQRYVELFSPGEIVIATEKLHGANGRFVWAKDPKTGEFDQYCGSRTNWLKNEGNNIWWQVFQKTPSIGEWCKANPEIVLYGEVFGAVQNLKYGLTGIAFAAFAVLNKGIWLDYDQMIASLNEFKVPTVPFVYRGPFDQKLLYDLAEENSRWPTAVASNQLSEGIVVVPEHERTSDNIGRVCLKIVSNRYLEM